MESGRQKSFFSCIYYDLKVDFDCGYLDKNILHRNYFDDHVTDYDCESWNHLKETFTSAIKIELHRCTVPTLPQKFLQRTKKVKHIKLDNSGIKSIDEKTIPDACSWEILSMSNNDLTELPPFLFVNAPNISQIDLSKNRIHNIDPNTFNGTTKSLKIINLSHNTIETLDKSLFTDLINLNELHLDYNFIEHFELDLSRSKDLSALRLTNNKLARLDCSIFNLKTNKISIFLNFNHIREIDLNCDEYFESLELYANHNQLKNLTFPKSNLLIGLKAIDASRNLIERVTFLTVFRQLQQLYLNDNNLKELFEWTDTMFPNLHIVDFSNNQFNCSYLTIFLKNVPLSIQLKKSEYPSEMTKTIHGINCIDNSVDQVKFKSGHSDDVDVERIVMWCLLGLLTIFCLFFVSFKVFKNEIRRNCLTQADSFSIYHENNANK